MNNEKASAAFFSGLLEGWISRLNDCKINDDMKLVICDMKDESIRLAKYAGVKIDHNI